MKILPYVKKMNTRLTNMLLIYSVMLLLGGNYLLYSFFELGAARNLIRAAAAGLMLVLLVFRLLEGRIRRRQVLMLLLAGWQILSGGTNGLNIAFLLILTVVVAGYREIRFTEVVLWTMAALTAVVLLSLLLGIEQDLVYRVGNRIRHKLGFVNVNSASMFFFTGLTVYLLFRDRKVSLADMTAVTVIEVILFLFTDSRTPLLGMLLMVGLCLLLPKISREVCLRCCRIGITLLFLSSFLWSLPLVNSDLFNKILSLRPQYFSEYITGQSLWTFLLGGSRQSEIDNGFLLLLFNTGIVVYGAVFLAVQSAAAHLIRKGSSVKLAYLLTMLCCSVLEGSAVRPELLCAPVLWVLVLEAQPKEGPESLLLTKGKAWIAPYLDKD